MYEDERGPFARDSLPVAFAEDFRSRLNFEFARRALRQARKPSRPVGSANGLQVRAAQERVRFERLHSSIILRYFGCLLGPEACLISGGGALRMIFHP